MNDIVIKLNSGYKKSITLFGFVTKIVAKPKTMRNLSVREDTYLASVRYFLYSDNLKSKDIKSCVGDVLISVSKKVNLFEFYQFTGRLKYIKDGNYLSMIAIDHVTKTIKGVTTEDISMNNLNPLARKVISSISENPFIENVAYIKTSALGTEEIVKTWNLDSTLFDYRMVTPVFYQDSTFTSEFSVLQLLKGYSILTVDISEVSFSNKGRYRVMVLTSIPNVEVIFTSVRRDNVPHIKIKEVNSYEI